MAELALKPKPEVIEEEKEEVATVQATVEETLATEEAHHEDNIETMPAIKIEDQPPENNG